ATSCRYQKPPRSMRHRRANRGRTMAASTSHVPASGWFENAAVAPWDYNPSSWSQRLPIALLALVAFVIATYMALFQWGLIDHAWDPIFGEQTARVLTSNVSHRMQSWIGFPDAALGALAYLGDAIFGLAGSTRRWQYRPWLVILFGVDVIPLGIVSVILVVLQGTVVGAWCFLCLVTAVISLILIALEIGRAH